MSDLEQLKHDLRTPLTVAILECEMLPKAIQEKSEIKKLKKSLQKMKKIMQSFE